MKKVILSSAMVGCFVLIVWLLLVFFSRFTWQKGVHLFRTGHYVPAVVCFDKAMKRLDMPVVRSMAAFDLFLMDIDMGKALYHQAIQKDDVAAFHRLLKMAHGFLSRAVAADPLDYRAVYWLAKTVQGLEAAHPLIYPTGRANPWNAGPVFEKALQLRPNGITVHFDLVNYRYEKGKTDILPDLARHMATIYPPSVSYLKKSPFYSHEIRKEMLAGLHIALEKKIMPWNTLTTLSRMALEEGDLDTAISHYQAALQCNSLEKSSADHLYMGWMLLKKEAFNTAASLFMTVLQDSRVFDKTLDLIYRQYAAGNHQAAFVRFAREVEIIFYPSEELDLLVAKALMDMGRMELARSRLIRLDIREPSARGTIFMARIAEKQKNWEQMELSAQKATVLDPDKCEYYRLLARALEHQGNYFGADKVLSQGIEHAAKPDPEAYNHRAWMRWKMNDFSSAVKDWQSATALQPTYSAYLFYIARAYKKMAQPEQALAFTDQALALKPNSKKYQQLRTSLISALETSPQ